MPYAGAGRRVSHSVANGPSGAPAAAAAAGPSRRQQQQPASAPPAAPPAAAAAAAGGGGAAASRFSLSKAVGHMNMTGVRHAEQLHWATTAYELCCTLAVASCTNNLLFKAGLAKRVVVQCPVAVAAQQHHWHFIPHTCLIYVVLGDPCNLIECAMKRSCNAVGSWHLLTLTTCIATKVLASLGVSGTRFLRLLHCFQFHGINLAAGCHSFRGAQ
jgi:hypothetical protein